MQHCRFCGRTELHEFVDLGHQPPSNSFLTKEQLDLPETYYPLKLYVCDSCWLVQINEYTHAQDIFNSSYPYYSSQSPTNVNHAKEYVEMMCERFKLNRQSIVYEIGSNDGYMLQFFLEHECNCIGFEPANGPFQESIKKGICTSPAFWSVKEAKRYEWQKADLICGINVLSHQPDINNFVEGLRIALAPNGIITMEFPHLMWLIDGCQWDTVYQEHYSYFSFGTVYEIFHRHGLEIFDVDEIPEHGGSLRIYARHHKNISDCMARESDIRINSLRFKEKQKGVNTINYYLGFQSRVDQIKRDLVRFLIEARYEDKMVVGYGAPAKGNTLLNYCSIRQDLMEFTVDRSPYKQGMYLPGSHIRVTDEEELRKVHPDYVLILPWNLKMEIMEQLKYIREWDGKFIIAIPNLEVI